MSDSLNKCNFDKSTLDHLLNTAQTAANRMKHLSAAQVERIVTAVAKAAAEKSEFYAEWAVRETGYGRVESKIAKNQSSSLPFLEGDIGRFTRPQVDTEKKIVAFPKPAGVIMALVPVTNPVCTVYFKALAALITRNAVILSPHPGSKECASHALDYLHEVAVAAGAPKGCMQIIRQPAVPLTQALMADERNNLTLATGGPAMVRAAYSSSNPAIGVGPGNVACYVDRTADVEMAAEHIAFSKSFDNSLPCTCESVIIADMPIAAQLKQGLTKNGVYFVERDSERSQLREYMFPGGKMNPEIIGKDAAVIAQNAGFTVPAGTLVLAFPISAIGRQEPFSKEKLCPVIGFIEVNGSNEGIQAAQSMLNIMGKGHSAVLHARNPELAVRYGTVLPVCRISVNTAGILGSSGNTTNLDGSAVIGTGFFGRSSVDRNVGPDYLVQWTRVAYNKDPNEVFGDMESAAAKVQAELDCNAESNTDAAPEATTSLSASRADLKALIREILADELREMLKK